MLLLKYLGELAYQTAGFFPDSAIKSDIHPHVWFKPILWYANA